MLINNHPRARKAKVTTFDVTLCHFVTSLIQARQDAMPMRKPSVAQMKSVEGGNRRKYK
jgi:hypothetical protein